MSYIKKVTDGTVATLEKNEKIAIAAKVLSKNWHGCLIVMDSNKPVGIVTKLDIVRTKIMSKANFNEPVEKIMSFPLVYMTPDMKLEEALKIVDTKGYRRYPVIDAGNLVGIVAKKDIVTAVSENLKFHMNIQTSVLAVFVLFELFVFFYFYLPYIT